MEEVSIASWKSEHLDEYLAEKLAADPFAKVKKLIDQMITRLLEEANADASREARTRRDIALLGSRLGVDIDLVVCLGLVSRIYFFS